MLPISPCRHAAWIGARLALGPGPLPALVTKGHLVTAFSMDLNGNAISVSNAVWEV